MTYRNFMVSVVCVMFIENVVAHIVLHVWCTQMVGGTLHKIVTLFLKVAPHIKDMYKTLFTC